MHAYVCWQIYSINACICACLCIVCLYTCRFKKGPRYASTVHREACDQCGMLHQVGQVHGHVHSLDMCLDKCMAMCIDTYTDTCHMDEKWAWDVDRCTHVCVDVYRLGVCTCPHSPPTLQHTAHAATQGKCGTTRRQLTSAKSWDKR